MKILAHAKMIAWCLLFLPGSLLADEKHVGTHEKWMLSVEDGLPGNYTAFMASIPAQLFENVPEALQTSMILKVTCLVSPSYQSASWSVDAKMAMPLRPNINPFLTYVNVGRIAKGQVVQSVEKWGYAKSEIFTGEGGAFVRSLRGHSHVILAAMSYNGKAVAGGWEVIDLYGAIQKFPAVCRRSLPGK